MMSSDLGSNIKPIQSIDPASITATTTGTYVPIAGFSSVAAVIQVGVVTTADASNLFTFSAKGATDASGTGATALTTYNPLQDTAGVGSVWDYLINSTTVDDVLSYSFGIIPGNFTHVAIVATETGTASAIFGATVVLGNPTHAPTLQSAETV